MQEIHTGAAVAAAFAFVTSLMAWELGLIALPFVFITAFVFALVLIA